MTRHADEVEIRELIARWAEGARAKDLTRVLERHAEDMVMFDVPLPIRSLGMGEYRTTWELFFDNTPGGPGSFDVRDLQITCGDTVAFCHALVKVLDSTARLTVGLRKEDGRWMIAHEHHSYPST